MPEGFFDPLPEGVSSKLPTRSGKFYDIEVYGDIYAEGGAISGDLDITGDLNITGGLAITGDMDIAGDMYSNNWVSGGGTVPLSLPDASATTGWALDGSAGTAQFQNIYAEGGVLTTLDISGALDLVSGGIIRTAPSGRRTEMHTGVEVLKFYSGDANELNYGYLRSNTDGITLASQEIGTAANSGFGQLDFSGDATQGQAILSVTGDGSADVEAWLKAYNPDTGDAQVVLEAKTTGGTGTGYMQFVADDYIRIAVPDVQFEGPNITLSDFGDQSIFKSGSGNLYIDNRNTSGRISVRADDSGGTIRTRILIYGNGNTDLYDNAGTVRGRISTQGFGLSDGSVAAPSLYFASDSNTGMYWYGTDGLAIAAGGRIAARFNEVSSQVEVRLPDVYGNTSSSDPYVRISTTGLLRQDSSQRKLKKDINYYGVPLVRLPVVSYTQKNGDIERLGLIAEDMADVDPRLALYNDDDVPVDWDVKGAIAVLQRQIDELVKKQEACNCAV